MLTLVTGATGLLGNNVVRLLLERGEAVRVLVRKTADSRPLAGLDVETVLGDVCDESSVAKACEGVGRVIHSAALVKIGWTGLDQLQAVNVEGTRNIAIAARNNNARMVHVSTSDAAGLGTVQQPADEETTSQGKVFTPYVVTKREAKQVIHDEIAEGLDAVIVNPGYMLGPWDWKPSSGEMLLEVARGRGLFAPRGHTSVVDVRDVAAGILAAFERGVCGRQYLLTGENLSYLELWRIIAEVTSARRPLVRLGPAVAYVVGRSGDLWGRLTGKEPNVNSGALAMAAMPKVYSHARAEQELGYHVRPLRETLADAWAWFQEHDYV